jgi:PBP1b-binding outer membrane lipoprotein LpoB
MNISENPRQASQSSYRISSLNIASAISALLLSSCIHYSDEYQSVSPTVKNNPPPYRPLSEL